MRDIIAPHGGELRALLCDEGFTEEYSKAKSLKKIYLNSKEVSDLIMLATGAFSPLDGFIGRDDYLGVVERMRLNSGIFWPMPVTVSVSEKQAKSIKEGQEVALVDGESGELMGSMEVKDKYRYDRKKEAWEVFHTKEEAHPGVNQLYSQGNVYLGGSVRAFSEGRFLKEFPEYARPAEVRKIFRERGWLKVTAFQTRNPMHRSHEYLVKIALEVNDHVLIHPIVGRLKPGDVPAKVRMRCYKVMLDNYFPKERVLLKVYPMEMRYGGPREALLHAIIRQNFGCSHIIIGRDHAGVGNYYQPFEAQRVFDELENGDLEIRPLKLDWTFWCYRCGGMASLKTCPHRSEDRLLISGTQLRKMLSEGDKPPEEFSRPEVLEILMDYYNENRSK
jgi:sulfate adenylyltransferase